MSAAQTPSPGARQDVIWQDASVAAGYNASRTGIPFADVHFDIMHRVLDASGITVGTLLDLGAGDGIATAEIASRHPVTRAVLTDFSEPMLRGARDRFAGQSAITDIRFVTGDFREDAWHTDVAHAGPYDAVISRFAIHHIPDAMKRALYGAILGWLRPGGMFVNIEHVESGSAMFEVAHDRLMIEGIMHARSGAGDVEHVTAQYRARQDAAANILASVWDQLTWLRELGFTDVDCPFKAFELAVFAGRRPPAT